MKHLFTILFAFSSLIISAQEDRSAVKSYPAMASRAVFLGKVPALRELKPRTDFTTKKPGKLFEKRNYFFGNELKNPHPEPQNGDPLVRDKGLDERSGGPQIIPGFNFEGLHDPSGIYPPDPTGDIGKNHYVQMVNTSNGSWFQVWDKESGNSVYGPAVTSTLWSEVGSGSIGDPIIQYDHAAERWLMLELQGFNSNELLVAISESSDPTGGWTVYRMQTLGFPDYPKLYVWNNAYFITINELVGGNKCSGYALERDAMLAAEPEFGIYRFEMPNFLAIQFQPATGADWEGGPPPPPGSPGYIFRIYDDAWDSGQDHLESWEVYVDWNNANQSHIDGPSLLYPQPFETRVCFGDVFSFDCIEQPGAGAKRLAAMENTILYRAPYRNFGDHESVVLNHVSDVSGLVGDGGDAEVRWYELRKSGAGDWQLYQQGTYAPDLQTNRFMGTISMDEAGNIGLGYSGCSENLYPGLYLTGHRKNDPPGEMTVEEYTLVNGGASHSSNRWGDYSSMAVDPYDGRTFWFTGEYQPDAASTWGTRIASFKVRRDTFDVSPEVMLTPVSSPFLGASEPVKVKITNGGLLPTDNVSVSLFFENNFIATNTIPGTIAAGASVDYTFNQTVAMPLPGHQYKFRIITHWNKDEFLRNDTLDASVLKLTANDASISGKYNLPGLVCGSETDFAVVLKNASGVPLHSARINWRLNTQPWQVYDWTGDLAPGARDTVELHAGSINDGLNALRVATSLPNGVADEKTDNDSLIIKFYGNTGGTYMNAESETSFGVLHWELRTLTDVVLAEGEVSQQQPTAQICSDDNECYRVALSANTFSWGGHFVLKDIFGNVLAEISEAGPQDKIFTVCTPERQQIDCGPLVLTAPVSGPNLGASEPVGIQFRNFGLTQLSNVSVAYRMNGGAWHTDLLSGPFAAGQTVAYTFAGTEDLSDTGNSYLFEVAVSVNGDQDPDNDTLSSLILNRYLRELALVGIDASAACSDTGFAFINLLVQNNGIGAEHTFDVEYSLNGVQQPTIPNNFLFAPPGESAEVPLYITGLKTGNNSLSLKIVNVDGGGADELPGNDSGDSAFEVSPDNQSMILFFMPDSKPLESSWDISDLQGNILASGGPYTAPLSFNLENICLKKDECYVFHLHDTGSDGMSGGYAAISVDGFTLFEYFGENFGSFHSIPFCATGLCATLSLTANVDHASGGGNNDGRIEAQASGGNPPYSFILNGGNPQTSAIFSNLGPGTYQLTCIDALGCVQEIQVSVGAVGAVEPLLARRLKASPNPTKGIVHLELAATGKERAAVCEVYDGHGKRLQTGRMNRWDDTLHGNIALDKFPAGLYYLRVLGLDRVYTARVVKK